MNHNPCITIDVSQNKSHIQGFLSLGKNLGKAKPIDHTISGYNQIITLVDSIKSITNQIPPIIFEYTGIYHKTLEEFLKRKNLYYHIVSPLRAAKSRKNDLRSVKTDKRDCLSLAKMFYNDNLGVFTQSNNIYNELRYLNRYYENILLRQQEIKVNFREILSIIYPMYKCSKSNGFGAFISFYSNESLNYLLHYPHPDYLLNDNKENFLINYNSVSSKIHSSYGESTYYRLVDYCSNIIPGCDKNSNLIHTLVFYINQILYYEQELNDTLNKLHSLAKQVPYYDLIRSIPCVKENLASRIVAEIGDINKYHSYKALVAITGTDPIIYQSGDNNGFHLHISKKGNKHLRTLLYLIVNQMIKAASIDSSIKEFYKKKTQQGLSKLAALIACCNKLIRIIYYMNKTGNAFI